MAYKINQVTYYNKREKHRELNAEQRENKFKMAELSPNISIMTLNTNYINT